MQFQQRNSRASKLTPGQVDEIRTKYLEGWTQSRLSREFGVTVGQIGRIVRGESWQGQRASATGVAAADRPEDIAERLWRVQQEVNRRGGQSPLEEGDGE